MENIRDVPESGITTDEALELLNTLILRRDGSGNKSGAGKWTPHQFKQLLKCRFDPWYFLRRFVITHDRERGEQPYPGFAYLRELVRTLQREQRIVILKSRQMMVTWTAVAFSLWELIFRGDAEIMFISKREDDAREAVRRMKFILARLPAFMCPALGENTRLVLEFPHRNARFMALPTHPHIGRTYSPTRIFWDEMASTPFAEEIFAALQPGLDGGGSFTGISTSQGPNTKHAELYMNAEHMGFTRVALHYSRHPEKDERWQMHARRGMSDRQWEIEQEMSLTLGGNRVYTSFQKQTHVVAGFTRESGAQLYRAIDFGYHTPVVLWAHVAGGTVTFFREWIGEDETVSDMAAAIVDTDRLTGIGEDDVDDDVLRPGRGRSDRYRHILDRPVEGGIPATDGQGTEDRIPDGECDGGRRSGPGKAEKRRRRGSAEDQRRLPADDRGFRALRQKERQRRAEKGRRGGAYHGRGPVLRGQPVSAAAIGKKPGQAPDRRRIQIKRSFSMRYLFKRLFGGNKAQEPAQLVTTRRPRGSRGVPFGGEWHSFESRSGLYRYMRSRIPIVSSAIWHWVRLCNTPGSFQFTGRDSHTREAEQVVGDLVGRIHSAAGVKRRVLGSLLELFFMEIFTNGSFCGRLIPLPSGKGIDYFEDIDADDIEWTRRGKWVAGLRKDDTVTALPEETFFHYGLGADRFDPRGVSFLSTVEFVTAIEQRMVDDMSRSSHNAGNPHLHIKIAPPERFENESETRYVKRAEKYFDDTVRMFREIDPDDNIFSWSDLEITVIGGEQAMPQSWRVNREQGDRGRHHRHETLSVGRRPEPRDNEELGAGAVQPADAGRRFNPGRGQGVR